MRSESQWRAKLKSFFNEFCFWFFRWIVDGKKSSPKCEECLQDETRCYRQKSFSSQSSGKSSLLGVRKSLPSTGHSPTTPDMGVRQGEIISLQILSENIVLQIRAQETLLQSSQSPERSCSGVVQIGMWIRKSASKSDRLTACITTQFFFFSIKNSIKNR